MRPLSLAICFLLIAAGLTAQQGSAQNRAFEQVLVWASVKKVCGRLRTVERGVFVPVPNKELHLYEAKWRKPCCRDLKLVSTRISSATGAFDFGDLQSGRYWLAVELDGVQHGAPIDVDVRHDWEGSCEVQGPNIEKNSIDWGTSESIM